MPSKSSRTESVSGAHRTAERLERLHEANGKAGVEMSFGGAVESLQGTTGLSVVDNPSGKNEPELAEQA